MPECRTERPPSDPPRLLDRLRDAIEARHYSARTAEAYVFWARKFIVFHGKRHPDTMGAAEIKAFLTYLAVSRKVAASTQNQALGALLFLYRRVLGRELDAPTDLIRAKRPVRIPVVLSSQEIVRILQHLRGLPYLAAVLMYGSGLRLLECLQLRVQDVDFERCEIVVRQGKGQKDRRTLLPTRAVPLLQTHLARLQQLHARDLKAGRGRVFLPESISRQSPAAAAQWGWQWLFPGSRLPTPAVPPGAPSSPQERGPASLRAGRPAFWSLEGSHMPQPAPFLRNPFGGGVVRHPHDPGIAGS